MILLGAVFIALVGLIGWAPPAMAQEEGEPPAEDEGVEEDDVFVGTVTVTDSLIPRADLSALSPVTVLEVEDELRYSGVNRIEDLVISLPQVFSAQNSTIANGASGLATIDLRNLGVARTLVLVNGRRMAPGDGWQGSASYGADLNAIPSSIVKRVDVLTGGASTTYGADAVAGVVNFVMDTEFEGVRIGFQQSAYQHDNSNSLAQSINEDRGFDFPTGSGFDGDGTTFSVTLGGKFADGKGHAVAYATYRDIAELTKGDRDYVNCAVSAGDDGPFCGGSSTIAEGRFIAQNADGSDNGDFMLANGNEFVPRAGTVFNYGPYNHLQRPDEKFSVGTFAHYTVSEHFEPYTELMFTSNETDAQIAFTGTFFNTDFLACDHPFLSEQQRNALCGPGTGYGPNDVAEVYIGKRNVEGTPRSNRLTHENMRVLGGVRGDINDNWSYDAYVLHAENDSTDVYNNDMSIARLALALDAVIDPESGEVVCRSGGNCVPYNLFQEGAITEEMTNYLTADLSMSGSVKTQVISGLLRGDLEDYGVKFPSASEGVKLALGYEYRDESLANFPDEIYQFGGATGQGGGVPKVSAGYDVGEFFLEARVPLVQDTPGAEDLSLELGFRASDYSTSGSTETWKTGINYAPSSSLRFRGGFNRAVRAPNIWDLFVPARYGLGGSNDICAGANPTATMEECARTGVTAAQYGNILANPADQYNNLGGGNPDLIPEEADTVTFGFVWTPENTPGLTLALDYYDIQIVDTVGSLGFDDILQQCANTGDPALCDLINRDSLGTLWLTRDGYIENTNQNIGERQAEGIDANFTHVITLGDKGYMPIDVQGTYTLTSSFTNPLVSYDCVGYFGFQCGQARPEWRHRARATWETKGNFSASVQWRHLGAVDVDDASPNPDIGDPDAMDEWRANGIDKIKAHNWFDLSASYVFKDHMRFTVGINNIFDDEPPLAPTFNDDFGVNLYSVYDPLGRYAFSSIEYSF
jgi:outer membrane receptor protein involved in Fe transport